MRRSQRLPQRWLLLLLLSTFAAGWWLSAEWPLRLTGVAMLPPGGDFTLESADGPLHLVDLRGQLVVIYFGYTACPDVCPTSLALLAQGLRQLSEAELAQIEPLFITLDPARDTPDQLAKYSAYFHPALRGAGGSTALIDALAQRYGVLFERQPADENGNYAVDHSSWIYLIDRQGRLVERLDHGTPPSAIASALRARL